MIITQINSSEIIVILKDDSEWVLKVFAKSIKNNSFVTHSAHTFIPIRRSASRTQTEHWHIYLLLPQNLFRPNKINKQVNKGENHKIITKIVFPFWTLQVQPSGLRRSVCNIQNRLFANVKQRISKTFCNFFCIVSNF